MPTAMVQLRLSYLVKVTGSQESNPGLANLKITPFTGLGIIIKETVN